ncbi:MAG: pesticidal protein Cry7Aa, partial [Nanoarchaeota archaeon]|nr:pesticidal protein Cry7Aa [Nanoarchaeota archaeon]
MVKIKRKLFMEPGDNDWEARAVLNPAVIVEGGVEHIFYRGVSKDLVSSIGHAKIINGKLIRFDEPVLWPTERYERRGVEDPRVTKVGDTYYMLYVAFDGRNARIAYATSKNLSKWKKMGIISSHISVRKARRLVKIKKYRDKWKHQEITGFMVSLWNKDAVLFPEKIDGKFVMLHRLMPDIQVLKFRRFGDLKNDDFWADYIENLGEGEDKVSLYRRYSWEGEHIGAGAVPIKTKKGWLLIYHGVNLATGSSSKKI